MSALGDAVYLRQLKVGPMENFVYLVGPHNGTEAFVVDPAWDAGAILAQAHEDGRCLRGVLLTHAHFDHTNALDEVLGRTGGTVYLHEKEAGFSGLRGAPYVEVGDGEILFIEGQRILCLHTPGHTPGSLCFLIDGHLICGDTLFIGACGRCDLPGGDPEALFHSLVGKLASLDGQTRVWPGHDYGTTPSARLDSERRTNPYLQQRGLEEFLRLVGTG
jgi:glyoxylase-like metal-dependent hydrolase (beta-lactamase superfamily II)